MMPGNPVVGGSVLRIPAIQSPNYVSGTSGWALNADGSAEFNDVTIRGSLTGVTSFSYSGTPAAGNLVQTSGITEAGTDSYGNHYLTGDSTYGSGYAVSVTGGAVQFYTGSLSGGWTAGALLETDSSGDLFLLAASGRSVSTNNNTLDNGSGDMTCNEIDVTGNQITVGGATITETNFNMDPPMGDTDTLSTLVSEMQNRGLVAT